jgi:hypothetical protein
MTPKPIVTKQIALVAALLLSLSSCDNLTPPNNTKTEAAPEQAAGAPKTAEEYLKQIQTEKPLDQVQRFVPLPETNGAGSFLWGLPRAFFAMDITTGQLCKTWEFGLSETAEDQRKKFENMPTCLSLYTSVFRPTKIKVWNEKTQQFEEKQDPLGIR